MNEEEKRLDELASALAAACSLSRPDEYQQRHNYLTRLMASYILREYSQTMEANDE